VTEENLTTPIGGNLSDRELRAIERLWDLEDGSLASGIRTGRMSVTVTAKAHLEEIKLSVTI
jgi:hypothetical protein